MPIMLNSVLAQARLPLHDVRLLRHQDKRAEKGRTPYELWRDDRPAFDLYQSHQNFNNRPKLKSGFWASFVGLRESQTLFAGLYAVRYKGVLDHDVPMPHMNGIDRAGTCDVYELTRHEAMSEMIRQTVDRLGSRPTNMDSESRETG